MGAIEVVIVGLMLSFAWLTLLGEFLTQITEREWFPALLSGCALTAGGIIAVQTVLILWRLP